MKKYFWMVMLLLVVLVPSAGASLESWKLDSAHTGVYFEVEHIFSRLRGHFSDFSAEVELDLKEMSRSRCTFVVKTKSIDTFNRKRDTHLRSDELFHAGKYPEMRFQSTVITPSGGDRYMMEGHLTIRGVTRKVRVPFTFHGVMSNPFRKSQKVAGFTAEFILNRLDYGVGDGKYVKMGVIGKDVKVTITTELIR
ncbi:MAG: YceI family protein [Desulfobacterales bacterium]|nr:YceI family protein [Desulfobacterales bacterium]